MSSIGTEKNIIHNELANTHAGLNSAVQKEAIESTEKLVNGNRDSEQLNKMFEVEDLNPSPQKDEPKKNPIINFLNKYGSHIGMTTNAFSSAFHTIAIATQAIPLLPKKITSKINKFVQEFARYVGPLNSLLMGIVALDGKRIIEAGIRISLPLLLTIVPFYNFTIPFGLHSGLNFFHDAIMENLSKKNGGKTANFSSFADNAKQVLGETKNIFKRLFNLGSLKELFNFKLGKEKQQAFACTAMALSSLATMFTARTERNTPSAIAWGGTRNLAGAWGDLLLMFGQKKTLDPNSKSDFVSGIKEFAKTFKHEKTKLNSWAGVFMGVGSILGVVHRAFVKSDWLANIIVHVQMLADNIGMTCWASNALRWNKEQAQSA